MSSIPPPADPHRRPNLGNDMASGRGDDVLRATWLTAVEAQRLARGQSLDPEAERLRAIVLANEALIRDHARQTRGRR